MVPRESPLPPSSQPGVGLRKGEGSQHDLILSPQGHCKVRIDSILWMRQLRLREVRLAAPGPTANQCRGGIRAEDTLSSTPAPPVPLTGGRLLALHSAQEMFAACSGQRASLVAQSVKSLPAVQETQVRSLGQEDPLEKEMATHSSLEKSHGQRRLVGCSPWGCKELGTTERLTLT